MEDFIFRMNLFVLNEAGHPSTYSHNGESNIDLTLVTGGLLRRVSDWSVKVNWTTSDHRVITFSIHETLEQTNNITSDKVPRYALRHADWESFDSLLRNRWSDLNLDHHITSSDIDVNLVEQIITKTIIKVCDETIPRKRKHKQKLSWWTHELSSKRKNVQKLRKNYQKERDPATRTQKRQAYVTCRNEYIKSINQTSQRSLENFITEHGNAEPWGFVYKFNTGKLKTMEVHSTLIKNDGQPTKCWEDTTNCLLDTLLPDDSEETDTTVQRSIRAQRYTTPATNNMEPFDNDEATSALMSMKNGKSPGLDYIEVEVIKRAWHLIGPSITHFMNACLEKGTFPKQWKNGQVTIIRKGGDRNPTDPKSYRPIMLLPVLGKLLEKLLTKRLLNVIRSSGTFSDKQFGFRENRSTEDAMVKMINIVKESEQKYVLGVFLDVSGAFDNLWWPSIMMELKKINCPTNLYSIMNDYFSNRLATIKTNYGTIQKCVNKGCPQGSVLGPHLWNLVFNSSMRNELQEVAFADDKVILVSGNSRQSIEKQAQLAINNMVNWCSKYKMELSSSKTVMIQLKGTLDIRRPPLVSINDQRIKMVKTVKWLGVDFDERLGVTSHVRRVSSNSKKVFSALKRVARETWGLKQGTLSKIYEGLVVSALTYASAGWADRMNCHHRRSLISAQRSILLGITKAYRTVATDAVQVLAGVIPIDILLEEKLARYKIRTRKNMLYKGIEVMAGSVQTHQLGSIKKKIRKATIKEWQERWSSSDTGRSTFNFLPSVEQRLEKRLDLSGPLTQMLTGHGGTAAYMKRFNLHEQSECDCGQSDETMDHVLYECSLNFEPRQALIQDLNGLWPASKLVLMLPRNICKFKRFCNSVLGGV